MILKELHQQQQQVDRQGHVCSAHGGASRATAVAVVAARAALVGWLTSYQLRLHWRGLAQVVDWLVGCHSCGVE